MNTGAQATTPAQHQQTKGITDVNEGTNIENHSTGAGSPASPCSPVDGENIEPETDALYCEYMSEQMMRFHFPGFAGGLVHLATRIRRRNERIAELEKQISSLQDPAAVHINMLRGTIAWTPEHLRHILGDSQENTTEQASPPATTNNERNH